ncbi:MAG: DUF3592 domain-containing protein [Candidatus Hodarchaeales archaeon]|jgi:hypothetical protein
MVTIDDPFLYPTIGGIGLVLLFFSIRYYLQARASLTWPSVVGTIVSSLEITSSGSEGGTQYRASITYSYNVNDRTYQATRVKIGIQTFASPNYIGAQRILTKYPREKIIIVYYDPNAPENAVLEPGLKKTWRTALTLSVAILGEEILNIVLENIEINDLIIFTGLTTTVIVGLLWFSYYLNK